ncbi:MAG TPA: hypothetical protein VFA94_03025 [Acidimicrobiales bacterium]|nr:hypothetical protein [Acidimicrobiales bacterium]
MRRAVAILVACNLAAAAAAAGPAGARSAGGHARSTHELTGARPAGPADPAGPGLDGIPANVPPAARAPERTLPVPATWPFPDAFPRTSGAERLIGGALEYSDFLYDDHGAKGVPRSTPVASLAPTVGTYDYAASNALMNGADIFRVAIGATPSATWWRVDWNTLADPNVPVVEFALDTDGNAVTGVPAWPGGAGVSSPGIDRALIISSRGATLLDTAAGGAPPATVPVTVDTSARSFVVMIPRTTLPVSGTWTVRVAAGVANAAGDGFAPVDSDHGALPGQPAVFNVGFRDHTQEPQASNFWMESAQANALAGGDISAFKATVDWAALDAATTTPEPQPTGYSNRWYVSSIGWDQQGVVKDSGNSTGDLRPNFLGRVQPYAVYIPSTYDPATPTPLTWILHSLGVQHNQYGAIDGTFVAQACEDRHSICATTLGRGPDGWYFDEAEVDFWEVWNRLALTYTLDPEHTVLSGYSMGGWATYKLGLAHPDLFAKAVVLAGPPLCGLRLAQGFGGAAGPGPCTTDGDSSPLIENARWLPYYIAHGTSDELVPVSSVLQQVKFFDDLGYRYRFELYPGQDHLGWAVEGMWPSAVAHMANDGVTHDPSHVTLGWYPYLDRTDHPEWGIGTTGAYWIRNPKAVRATPGSAARIDAVSTGRAAPTYTPQHVPDAVVPGQPTPGVVVEQTWQAGPDTLAGTTLSLRFDNVATVTVDLAGAGFAPGTPVTVTVMTAAPAVITFKTSTGDQAISAAAGTYTVTA